jgi:hypothetical protein
MITNQPSYQHLIIIGLTLRYVFVQGSVVSGLQERNRTCYHKICRATCYTIRSIVGGILQSRYQLLLAAQGSAVSDVNFVYNEIYE